MACFAISGPSWSQTSSTKASSQSRQPFTSRPNRCLRLITHLQAQRREVLHGALGLSLLLFQADRAKAETTILDKYEPMDALKGKDYGKPRLRYQDYDQSPSGLQTQDLRMGGGASPQPGDVVVVDWDGYTIGYYGRPFEARNKARGGSFTGDSKDFLRFTVGSGQVIPALDEAVRGMKVGGIRRIIVPVELGYPLNKKGLPDFNAQGPKPTTFAGQRALDFVLKNQGMIDKTLLFDLELIRVDAKST